MSCASKEMDINEKWLGEIGGWAAMKAARSIVAAGGVEGATQEGEFVRGKVGSGKTRFASGLRIRSRTDVDNLCTCPTARRGGGICEHSIAVALAVISPPKPAALQVPVSRVTERASVVRAPTPCPKGSFSIYLANDLFSGAPIRRTQVFLKFDPGGGGQELALYQWLSTRGVNCQTQPLALDLEDLSTFLEAIAGHPRVFRGRPSVGGNVALTIADTAIRIPLRVTEIDSDTFEAQVIDSTVSSIFISSSQAHWCYCSSTEIVFPVSSLNSEVNQFLSSVTKLNRSVRGQMVWFVKVINYLEESFNLELAGDTLRAFKILPVQCSFECFINGVSNEVVARPYAFYSDHRWRIGEDKTSVGDESSFPIRDSVNLNEFYVKNFKLEELAIQLLAATGFEYIDRVGWVIRGADQVMKFFASGVKKLGKLFDIKEEKGWDSLTRNWVRIAPRAREVESTQSGSRMGNDWLSLEIAYDSPSGFRISRSEVLQMIRVGRRSNQDKVGRKFVLDVAACEELEEALQDVDVRLSGEGGQIRSEYASALLEREDETDLMDVDLVKTRLGEAGGMLRDYQVTGVQWLERLARQGRGALLADDMGLGKTLQTISVLRLLADQDGLACPSLVICPKSLIVNWQSELERFAPRLKVLPIVGDGRQSSFKKIADFNVILTTYQLVVRDLDEYNSVRFRAIVLDEASYIRNAETEASKAIRKLQAGCRIALTGTPIENGIRDLWSIFQFLMPGYLGSKDTFKERFEKSLSSDVISDDAKKVAARLKKLVKPYVLRRTKAEVLTELPEKIEQVIWCELSPAQNEIYRRVLDEGTAEIRDARKRSGDSGARMTMFTVLLRLRQICCDLRLTGIPEKTLGALPIDDLSGKVSVWLDRVREIIANGGKVLVFSQFVKFLQILKNGLEGESIRFSYLDGSTQDRGKPVKTFQEDPDCRVFLISLKAGGYGLNLTSANHVILMEPWWNPAVEAQAIDRAHRMGQNRSVTALRLVMRGTVEEKILRLQAKKRGVIEATLDESGSMGAGLSDADLQSLIEA